MITNLILWFNRCLSWLSGWFNPSDKPNSQEQITEAIKIAQVQFKIYSQYKGKDPYPFEVLAEMLLRHHYVLVKTWDSLPEQRSVMIQKIIGGNYD